MARAEWLRFRRPAGETNNLASVLAHAAAGGAPLEELLELAVRGLLQVSSADRAAVWLESLHPGRVFTGTVREAGSEIIPESWKSVDFSLPPLRSLLESVDPVVVEVDEGPGMTMIGPLVGMRTAAWIPVRAQQRTLGLALVAFARPARKVDTVVLQSLADELAFVVVQQRGAELSRLQQQVAEQKAHRVEAQLRSLLNALDSGVLLFDAGGELRMVNERFGQLLGLDVDRIREVKSFEALVEMVAGRFRDAPAVAERWRELAHRGEEPSWDTLELLPLGRKIVERCFQPVRQAGEKPLGWWELYRDISDRRVLDSRMLRTEKLAALGQLVSGIAHELNNPLTSIMGYAQLLACQPAARRGGDAVKIYQEAERAGRIVRNLLLFTREAPPERQPVNLNEVVERTLGLRAYELRVENIATELELDANLPPVRGDANQLQQVVLNLIVNAEQAIQLGRGKGGICVRTWRSAAERVALEVADDGPGIAAEIASRIFDPFFTTKPAGMGTGLGLSIVYGIVQEHDGTIAVESQPGRGAKFTVELPMATTGHAAEARDAADEARPATTPAESGGPLAARPERVLIVEDEPTVAQLIADVLRDEGHHADTVLDGREALDSLSRETYDLVICDFKMPHMDGRAFYRALGHAGSPLQHRLVFVTGDMLTPHTLEFLENTGLPYLAKPFLIEELKLAVRRALAAGRSPARVAAGETPAASRVAGRK